MEILFINYLRAFAFILMFIYHIFVFLKVQTNQDYLNNYFIDIIGIISRNIFIILVGVSLYLSYKNSNDFNSYRKKQLYRSIKIYLCAIFITIFTYYSIFNYYVVFGVLHFISLAILLLHNFINNFIILGLFLIICMYFNYNTLYLYSSNSFINYLYNILGFHVYKNTIDSFPIIKWLPKVIIGIFIGYFIHKFYKNNKQKNKSNNKKSNNKKSNNKKNKHNSNNNNVSILHIILNTLHNIIDYIGKNTLVLYVIHIPILFFIIKMYYNL